MDAILGTESDYLKATSLFEHAYFLNGILLSSNASMRFFPPTSEIEKEEHLQKKNSMTQFQSDDLSSEIRKIVTE